MRRLVRAVPRRRQGDGWGKWLALPAAKADEVAGAAPVLGTRQVFKDWWNPWMSSGALPSAGQLPRRCGQHGQRAQGRAACRTWCGKGVTLRPKHAGEHATCSCRRSGEFCAQLAAEHRRRSRAMENYANLQRLAQK